MAEICRGVVNDKDMPSTSAETTSRAARRKRMEMRKVKYAAGVSSPATVMGMKRSRLSISTALFSHGDDRTHVAKDTEDLVTTSSSHLGSCSYVNDVSVPKFGVASVCGRRREMEDCVAIHPSFMENNDTMHYYGVYDGHGCSHVAKRCKERLHLLVNEELSKKMEPMDWNKTMEQSFSRMDQEVIEWNQQATTNDCRCELHAPESYGVGSTAVVAVVTPDKIIVANCGDSRAILCRNGKAVPLSIDHKPDRPDELSRIEAAGGRVLYWEGARVCGVLAMSRAIGDNYLKPYVTCEPEVTITDRTSDDDFLILASDGLWDVVSNDTACGLASMCLKGNGPSGSIRNPPVNDASEYENCDKACSDASVLLAKLALARRSADNVSVVVVNLKKTGS
ncbi:Protein phosphatase 2C [Artemisia annua]|uniref:protein-serine/threonine phosphatase n=1 Tax=Artemisia annua TaxID=35608 RepID=A0A2U1NU48_ARTAN|nr:Protein phosphatase 2C [Artemisia annua]